MTHCCQVCNKLYHYGNKASCARCFVLIKLVTVFVHSWFKPSYDFDNIPAAHWHYWKTITQMTHTDTHITQMENA